MLGYIDNFDFREMEPMRYYAHPKSYKGDPKEEARKRVFSGEWMGARKMDGYFSKFVKDEDGNMMLLSRSRGVSGDFANKLNHVPQLQNFFESLPIGTCVLGEIYFPMHEGSSEVTKVMGALTDKAIVRQKDDKLHFYIFDVLAWNGKSLMDSPAKVRMSYMYYIDNIIRDNRYIYASTAKYFWGQELWNMIADTLAAGGEGGVILNENGLYQPGKRSTKISLKIKKELEDTIDCFFTGRYTKPARTYTGKEIKTWEYWLDTKTNEFKKGNFYKEFTKGAQYEPVTKSFFYGMAGSLEIAVYNNDKIHPIGFLSGLTEEIKSNPDTYAGRVIEVSAMQLTDDKMLRHPKFVRFRDDKDKSECQWRQIEEM